MYVAGYPGVHGLVKEVKTHYLCHIFHSFTLTGAYSGGHFLHTKGFLHHSVFAVRFFCSNHDAVLTTVEMLIWASRSVFSCS